MQAGSRLEIVGMYVFSAAVTLGLILAAFVELTR
jgi:hypothetical protein